MSTVVVLYDMDVEQRSKRQKERTNAHCLCPNKSSLSHCSESKGEQHCLT